MSKPTGQASIMRRISRNWSHFKSRLLFRYALSYILIFLIPLSVVTVFIYENAVKSLRIEIEQANVNQLNQVKMTIDSRVSELLEISGKIAYDERLTPYMVRHPYYSREAIRALDSYKANSSILEDLFLYFHKDTSIYSTLGLSDLDVAFNKIYHFPNWQLEQLKVDLNDTRQPLMRPAETVTIRGVRQESMLTMLVPIKPNDLYPNGTLVYLMKESQLTGMMDSILSDFAGSSFIFDQTNQVLTANNRGSTLEKEEIALLADLTPGIHSLVLGGEQHSVVSVKSRENGWTYLTTMPSYQFFSRIAHIQTLILLVFSIAVITGVVAAMLLARKQYHPIKDLLQLAERRDSPAEAENAKTRNEWEWIRQTIQNYSIRIDQQNPFVRQQCLLLLIKHGQPDDPEINRMMQSAGIRFPEGPRLYFAAIVAWDEPLSPLPEDEAGQAEPATLPYKRLQERLSDLPLPELDSQVYGVEFTTDNQFALLISLPDQREEPDQVRLRVGQIIETIQAVAAEHNDRLPSIGIGTVYPGLTRLNQSFIEAATALEYRTVGGSGQVAYFERLAELPAVAGEGFWISRKSTLKLEQSLKQGNSSVALQMITEIIDSIKQEAPQMYLLRCLCFDLLNALLRTATELGMHEALRTIPSLTSFETLEELEDNLGELTMQICLHVERKTETEQTSLIDDIVAYVDQQYADYTLSLEHLALKYSISTSYLSRSFKDKTGYTFSQYIWQLRMNEVIRLLTTTEAPLQEIIEQVGYYDAPNFIRKFKKETGSTPGQYRKEHTPHKVPKPPAE